MIKVFVLLILLTVIIGLPKRIEVNTYPIYSDKVKRKIRVSVIADLHCNLYGKNQKYLVNKIVESQPDVIVIPGDLFDTGRNYENVFALVSQLKQYPVYFSEGNHEAYLKKDIDTLCERLQQSGVVVLRDCVSLLEIENTKLQIGGLKDRGIRPVYSPEETDQMFQKDGYRILLSHRPDAISYYEKLNVDLIVCGHDHGGQWRIPFTHQGIFAPAKGFFPKYTEGVHDLGGPVIAISRGIASGKPQIPRLFNDPEIMVLEIRNKND